MSIAAERLISQSLSDGRIRSHERAPEPAISTRGVCVAAVAFDAVVSAPTGGPCIISCEIIRQLKRDLGPQI
jgi:hypothetical protein